MKHFTLVVCLGILVLFFVAAVPALAAKDQNITAINPSVGYTDNVVRSYTITGQNFLASQETVLLQRSGKTNITADGITSWSPDGSKIVCTFRFSSSKTPGTWNLIIIRGDNLELVFDDAVTLINKASLTSISPESGRAGTKAFEFTLTGKNFRDDNDDDIIDDVFLFNKDYANISATDFTVESNTKITGTFDLRDIDEDTYDVCVRDNDDTVVCDPSFEVTTNKRGSLDVSSNPSGANIFIDGMANGTTPNTIDDLLIGSHKVILRKTGYEEWGKTVNIEEDETAEIDAKLYASAVATTAPPAQQTANPTTRVTTTKPPAKSTIKIPTTYAEVPTTAASPVDPVLIAGTLGLAVIVLRKR